MGKHQEEVHPEFVDGCDMCRWSSVAVAPSATPTRQGGAQAAAVNAKEKQWSTDMAAYKSIRSQGIQPRSIDGAAHLQNASDKAEVEMGHVFKTKQERASMREGVGRAQEMAAE